MANLAKNEMRDLREDLDLSQAEMGEAMGIEPKNAQGTWRRWEADPSKPAARKAFEKAKEIYKNIKGMPWVPKDLPMGAVSREEFLKMAGRLEKLEKDFAALSPTIDGVKHLDQRVQKLENRKGSRG